MKKPVSTGKHATVVTILESISAADRSILQRLFPKASITSARLGSDDMLETADMRIRYGNIGVRALRKMIQDGPFTLKLITDGFIVFLIHSDGHYAWIASLESNGTYSLVKIRVKSWLLKYDLISRQTARRALINVINKALEFSLSGAGTVLRMKSLKEAEKWVSW